MRLLSVWFRDKKCHDVKNIIKEHWKIVSLFWKKNWIKWIQPSVLTEENLNYHTAKNTVISPNFLVWKFCRKAQFLQTFGRIARNYAETVPFHKISTPGLVKLRYFSQCYFHQYFLNIKRDLEKVKVNLW